MELLTQVSNTQFLFPAAAVAAVLICAALVFTFGFKSAEQPQFDKLPLVVDDRKSSNKKRKTKEKKSSPNRNANEDTRTKSSSSESSKKSPVKEKGEEKVKEQTEKSKLKEKAVDPKAVKKNQNGELKAEKRGKKGKQLTDEVKPIDYDEGDWEEVPKKSEKKKTKPQDEKKESPVKKGKKKVKETEPDAKELVDDEIEQEPDEVTSTDNLSQELQEKVNELHRVLKAAELRDNGVSLSTEEETVVVAESIENNETTNKKKKDKKNKGEAVAVEEVVQNTEKEKVIKEVIQENSSDENTHAPVFDELGDTWTDTKLPKKSKKKVRKDQ